MGTVGFIAALTAALAAATAIAPKPGPARLRRVLVPRPSTRVGAGESVGASPRSPVGQSRRAGLDSEAEGRASTAMPRIGASVAAALGGVMVIGGIAGGVLGVGLGILAWFWTGRLESAKTVREREQITAAVPLAAELLAAALAAGCPPEPAAEAVGAALPGPLGTRLAVVASALRVGTDPATAWRSVGSEPGLNALGRAMADAATRGTSPVAVLERIARDAEDAARWAGEARARAVGARAAVPLGLCFLPAFVLVGVVPMIATSLSFLP